MDRELTQDERKLFQRLLPESLRKQIILSGLFLAGYEILKNTAIDRIRDFLSYEHTTPKKGELYRMKESEEYKAEVRTLHKDLLEASLMWLVTNDALTQAQYDRFAAIRSHRNELAHELQDLLVDPDREVNVSLFAEMQDLLRAIGLYWARIDISTDPQFDGVEVTDADIKPGIQVLMDFLVQATTAFDTPSGA